MRPDFSVNKYLCTTVLFIQKRGSRFVRRIMLRQRVLTYGSSEFARSCPLFRAVSLHRHHAGLSVSLTEKEKERESRAEQYSVDLAPLSCNRKWGSNFTLGAQ